MKNSNLKDFKKRKVLKKFELIFLQKKISKIINRNFLERFNPKKPAAPVIKIRIKHPLLHIQ